MLVEQIRERLVALTEKGEAVLLTHTPNPPGVIGAPTLDDRPYTEWRSQASVLLAQVFDPDHTYTVSFGSLVDVGARIGYVERGLGVLEAALEDVERGHLETVRELATAEVFSDFLEQADHLLRNGYSVPAASLACAVLENGLRSLAARQGINVSARDNLSSLNHKIGDKGVYTRLRQSQVSVWIKVRNSADHGRFTELRDSDVADLIKGVRDLLSSVT